LDASDKIKKAVEVAKAKVFPDDIEVTIFNDQSIQTRSLVDNLENSIISGVILVVLVLLFFLGLRNAMFVGLAIPLSMLMGILIINVLGYSLNMMVLFSLILALGMLVDNAIVVVENVYRYMQQGYTGLAAAKHGTGEVALPIIASTATTLAAFVPLAFWPGIMGSFMKYMPITLIIVLSSSLFIALVINPVFTSRYMKIDEREDDPVVRKRKRRNVLIGILVMLLIALGGHFSGTMWVRNLFGIAIAIALVNFFILRGAAFWFQQKVLPALERGYNWFIKKVLHKYTPVVIFFGTFMLLFFTFFLLGKNAPQVVLFPEKLRGDEIDTLANVSESLIAYINSQNIGGIEELKADVNIGKREPIESENHLPKSSQWPD